MALAWSHFRRLGLGSLFSAVLLTSCASHSDRPMSDAEYEADDEVDLADDAEYLDGFVGLGGGFIYNQTEPEHGHRRAFRAEFSRIRKWIEVDARVAFGQKYSDYGGLFRIYKHWRFDGVSATGLSLGGGFGAMFSDGREPAAGKSREAFIDVIGAPFLRFIWDFGYSMGMSFEGEWQIVPKTMFVNDNDADSISDVNKLRHRFFASISLLFEID